MYRMFEEHEKDFGTEKELSAINSIYEDCENISIDYGIMEKSDKVKVILSDFGWSDLGTWGSLSEHLAKDERSNAYVGTLLSDDSNNNVIYSSNKEKLIAIEGCDDLIVVDTDDALLIIPKSREQEIKKLVNTIKEKYNKHA